MRLIAVAGVQSPAFHVEPEPAALGVVRVEVHYREHDVIAGLGLFAVGNQLIVVRWMKIEPIVGLEGGIFPTNSIHLANELGKVAGSIAVPMANLIFFGIKILLAARFASHPFAEF